ncbi:U4/U6.U5 tri-snRNP-associated protein 1 [Haemaphysalis longicornis]
MGSSKKHKEKDREKDREKDKSKDKSKDKKKARRSRSKSRERDATKEKHRHRDRKRTRGPGEDEAQPAEKVRVKEEREVSPKVKQEHSGSESDGGHRDKSSLSIEETNKLRAKLGLKPLQVDGGGIPGLGDAPPGDGDTEQPGGSEKRKEVFVKTENMLEKVEAQKLRDKIAANREKRKITEKYKEMKTLGDAEDDIDDPLQWVKRSRRIEEEKRKAKERAKLLEEMDAEFGVGKIVEEELRPTKQYTAKHLKGIEVLHSMDRFKEGQSIILTLKDQAVLDEGDDVLENVNLVDSEKAERNVENRKGKPGYQPYEDTEVDEFGIVKKKSLLYKYDEEIEGVKQDKFRIGAAPSEADKERELEIVRMKLKQKQVDSLIMPAPQLATEYLTPEEMTKFKKAKRKVRKVRKRESFKADDLTPLPGHSDDNKRDHGSRRRHDNFNEPVFVNPQSQQFFGDAAKPAEEEDVVGPDEDLTGVAVDEDEAEQSLEAALSKARRIRQVEGSSVQKIAESARLARDQDEAGDGPNAAKAIVLNSTAEFCRTLGDIPTYGMSGNRDEEAEELLDMDIEQEDEDQAMLDPTKRGQWNEVDVEERPVEIKDREKEPILEEEPDLSLGVMGALKLAVKKGYIDTGLKKDEEPKKHSALHAQSYTIEEKYYDDDKAGRRGERYCGPVSDFKEKDAYKPDVRLEYIDDGGRQLNAKEAFRYLSHKFHGKGSGKNKVDKRAKKLDQHAKLKQMSSTDTPLSTLKLLQEKQKELQSPYILLSGGSKALNQSSLMKPK